jgi:hypothetical protein
MSPAIQLGCTRGRVQFWRAHGKIDAAAENGFTEEVNGGAAAKLNHHVRDDIVLRDTGRKGCDPRDNLLPQRTGTRFCLRSLVVTYP